MAPHARSGGQVVEPSQGRMATPSLEPRLQPAGLRGLLRHADLAAAAALAALAALATVAAPGGHPARLVLAGAATLLAPGYLLLEAALPARAGLPWPEPRRLAMAAGASLPLAALAALATALLPRGFTASNIVLAVTCTSLALAGLALVRRASGARGWEARAPAVLRKLALARRLRP